MSFIAAAVIGGVGAIAGGLLSAHGAQSAADTQANAANRAADISQQEFNTITQQESPFMQSGYGAQGQLNYLLGIGQPPGSQPTSVPPLGPSGGMTFDNNTGLPIETNVGTAGTANASSSNAPFTGAWWGRPSGTSPLSTITGTQSGGYTAGSGIPSGSMPMASGSSAGGYGSLLTPFTADNFRQLSPAYQFQLQQGQQGVLNADASGQGALSGAAMKDLIGYNQGLANTSFGNAFNQYQTQQGNIFNRLSSIAQLGQNAAANTGAQGTALTGQVAQSISNAGSAQAAGQVGAANAYSGALGNIASLPWLMSAMRQPSGGSMNPWGA